jgi:hypothetical protein
MPEDKAQIRRLRREVDAMKGSLAGKDQEIRECQGAVREMNEKYGKVREEMERKE